MGFVEVNNFDLKVFLFLLEYGEIRVLLTIFSFLLRNFETVRNFKIFPTTSKSALKITQYYPLNKSLYLIIIKKKHTITNYSVFDTILIYLNTRICGIC